MSRPPKSAIPHQGIEERKQLPHARHQSHLLRFARSQEPLVELLEDGVVAGGDQGSHVEGCPHWSPAAPHLPLATSLSRVIVEGSDSHQGREAFVGERTQFGHFGQKRPRQDRSHPRNAAQQSLVLFEAGARFDGLVEVPIGARKLLLKPLHVRPDAPRHCLWGHLEAVVLGDEHPRELASSGEDGLQELGFFIREYAGLRTDSPGEASEDTGVYSVGLGEATGGLGEVASLARVYNRNGDARSGYGCGRRALVAASGLQDDQLWAHLFEPFGEGVDPLLVVGDGEGLPIGHEADVEGSLGDVDAYCYVAGNAQAVSPSSPPRAPGLADTGSLGEGAAPATVRAPPVEGGRDDPCFLAVSLQDQGGYGLSRPHRPHSTTKSKIQGGISRGMTEGEGRDKRAHSTQLGNAALIHTRPNKMVLMRTTSVTTSRH